MTDNLRDRITAAIYDGTCFGWSEYQCEEAADVVIEALNLKFAVDYMSVDGQRRNFMLAGNYTTENQ